MAVDFSNDETRAQHQKMLEDMAARTRAAEQPFWKRSSADNQRIAHDCIMRVIVGGGFYVALAFGAILIIVKHILLGVIGLIDQITGTKKK